MANQKKIQLQGFRFKPFSAKQLKLLTWWQDNSPVKDKFMVIADGSIRAGKEQPLDATLFTPNGAVKMGDIKIGHAVFDRQGNPTKVIGIFPQGVKDVYKVTFQDGSSTECGLEHLWTYRIDEKEPFRTSTLAELKEILGNNPSITKSRHYDFPINGMVDFNPQGVSMNPYLLGLMIGDGSSGEYTEDCIPDVYKFNSEKIRLYILAGILNVAGTHHITDFIHYRSRSAKLTNDVIFLARSLGMFVLKNNDNDCYIRVNKHLYELLADRYKRVIELTNNSHYRHIKSIEYVGKKECQCIYVDNEEHLYLTDDFIVTHNTVAMILSFVLFVMKTFNQQNAAMCGKSVGSFRRNVLVPLKQMLLSMDYDIIEHRSENYVEIIKGDIVNYFYIFGARLFGTL